MAQGRIGKQPRRKLAGAAEASQGRKATQGSSGKKPQSKHSPHKDGSKKKSTSRKLSGVHADLHARPRSKGKPHAGRGIAVVAPVEDGLCPQAGQCGGCTQVNRPYADQLTAKDAAVRDLFGDGAFAGVELRPILGMEDPFHYRNKVASPFAPGKRGPNGGREILTGMYAAGTHRLVPTDDCLLENEQAQQVIASVRTLMKKYGIAPYDENRGSGFMRHAVVRVGHESGEVLVTLVTNEEVFPNSKRFCHDLVKRCSFITTIVQNVNTRQTNVILGDREQRLYGPGFILDTLCGLSFRISSQSFYQVNAVQTTVLYETAIELAGLDGTQRVVDAYCGTGTIGLVAAKRGAAEVIGVDVVADAIRDARENARHNGVDNARFFAADAGAFMRDMAADGQSVDVVLMDPPRAGSTEEFLEAVVRLAPQRVVYISCNPRTQQRDALYLAKRGYRLELVQPVDMFPHTDHVEAVGLLCKM